MSSGLVCLVSLAASVMARDPTVAPRVLWQVSLVVFVLLALLRFCLGVGKRKSKGSSVENAEEGPIGATKGGDSSAPSTTQND